MKCKYCGAPLDLSLDTCLYCRNKITFDNKFSKKERYIRIVLACVVFLVGIISIFILISFIKLMDIKWGLGIGDWGLGIGDWAQSPIPNPQSPIPNPQ